MGNAVPKLSLALSNSRYVIHVYTGDKLYAGTDANVYLTLEDSKGHTTPKLILDHFLFDDLERGTCCSYPLPDDKRLDDVTVVNIWRDHSRLQDDWFLDAICLEDRKFSKKNWFPFNKWVKPTIVYHIALYGWSLPQLETNRAMSELRKQELIDLRFEYQYWQMCPEGPVEVGHVPAEDRFSLQKKLKIKFSKARHKFKIQSLSIHGSGKHSWNSFDEMVEECKKTFGEPQAARYWKTDRWFGLQRLQGCNPILIELCYEIPDKFGIASDMIEPFLEGETLETRMEQNKIFIVDLKILYDIKCHHLKELSSPLALFYLNTSNILLPIAIQLGQYKGPRNPIFLPNDSPNLWLLAKMFYNNAESQHHQAISHLGHTHLVMEGVDICTHRHLSSSHPIYRLLKPHFLFLLTINRTNIQHQLSRNGHFDRHTTIGSQGLISLFIRSFKKYNFQQDTVVPKQIFQRGVDDPNILPYYPYRDDAKEIYSIIERYVRTLVEHFYDQPIKIKDDWELKRWRLELSTDRELGGVGLRGLPGTDHDGFTNCDEIIEILTAFVSTCTLSHGAFNNELYNTYGFFPNYPITLNGPIPREKVTITDQDLLNYIPDKHHVRDNMLHAHVHQGASGNKPLGHFDVQYLYDPVSVEAAEKLREELEKLEEKIEERNKNNDFPYAALYPSSISNSMSS